VDPLLTMRFYRQLVASDGNGFGLLLPFSGSEHLPLVATGCAPVSTEPGEVHFLY
jgi:hypothetical protein